MKQEKDNSESSPCDLLTLEDGSSQEDEEVSPGDKDGTDTNLTSRLSQKYGRGISAASCSSTLQSLTVRRPLHKQKNDIRNSTEVISQVSNSSSPEVVTLMFRAALLPGRSARLQNRQLYEIHGRDSP